MLLCNGGVVRCGTDFLTLLEMFPDNMLLKDTIMFSMIGIRRITRSFELMPRLPSPYSAALGVGLLRGLLFSEVNGWAQTNHSPGAG